jgi:hypothetical protein
VQLLLPLYDNHGRRFARALFDRVRGELTEEFGGITAYRRSPAEGLWKEKGGEVKRDDVVIFEVMVEALSRAWWAQYRQELERRFRQDEVVIRAIAVERL